MATRAPAKAAKTAPEAAQAVVVAPKPAKAIAKAPAALDQTQTYRMPVDVANWIEQAESRLRHAAAEIERLKSENRQLKRDNRAMEQRVLGRSDE
jgi:hypothetical protein